MSDETTVPPALTAEEWKRGTFQRWGMDNITAAWCVHPFVLDLCRSGQAAFPSPETRVAIAAVCLASLPDGHPQKFTREDVDELREAAEAAARPGGAVFVDDYAAFFHALAARIAALLPPEA